MRPWGIGRLLWFAYGISFMGTFDSGHVYYFSAYELDSLDRRAASESYGGQAFLWCLPLMSLFVPAAS